MTDTPGLSIIHVSRPKSDHMHQNRFAHDNIDAAAIYFARPSPRVLYASFPCLAGIEYDFILPIFLAEFETTEAEDAVLGLVSRFKQG